MLEKTTPGLAGLRSLGLRLVLLLVGATLVITTGTAWLTLTMSESAWHDNVEACGRRMGENILVATRSAMLSDQKEDVAATFERLAEAPDVESVAIHSRLGRVAYGAGEVVVGQQRTMGDPVCMSCHVRPGQALHSSEFIHEAPRGYRVLSVNTAILNEDSCSGAGCHPADTALLGSLEIQLSLENSDRSLGRIRLGIVVTTLTMVTLVGLITWVVVGRLTTDLARAQEKNLEWSRTLEVRVAQKSEELERTREGLVHMEKMASLGKLSATVAHELNNPLSGILTYSKLVDRILMEAPEGAREAIGDRDFDGARRFLEVIEREAARCGQIVKNLLLFSRDSEVHAEAVELAEIVERALMLVRHHLDITGIELVTEPTSEGVRIHADANQIQQALVALMMNAVEAMAQGGTLTLGYAPHSPELVCIEISDTGGGIPEGIRDRIFEPFFSTKDSTAGVGLGLAVVYGIIQRHGGEITVESQVGQGTTFRILLPAADAPESP